MLARRGLLGLGMAAALATPALAFPERTITLAVGFAPGGSTDV
jgi:tripartite-type tricarboxylate transporter receptor subunit TctC